MKKKKKQKIDKRLLSNNFMTTKVRLKKPEPYLEGSCEHEECNDEYMIHPVVSGEMTIEEYNNSIKELQGLIDYTDEDGNYFPINPHISDPEVREKLKYIRPVLKYIKT